MRRAIRCVTAGTTALLLVLLPLGTGLGGPLARAAGDSLAAGGTTIVNETFAGASVQDPAWKPGGTACLSGRPATGGTGLLAACTASKTGPVPTLGVTPGYLQLTDAKNDQAGSVLYNRPIPATAGVQASFEQYQYGGTDADGISFFLVDGATTLATTGANGGSLGYAQKSAQNGVPGGYLGVGLDVYGNYYDDAEGRGKDCPADQRSPSTLAGRIAPNVVTLRGPGSATSGYCFLQATVQPGPTVDRPISTLPGSLTGATGVTNPQLVKRTVNVQVTPEGPTGGSRVIVDIDFNDGKGYQRVLDVPAPDNEPSTYKFGFAGSTGGSTDVHLLRNVVVQSINPLDKLQLVKQIDRTGTALPADITAGTAVPYQFVVTNAGTQTVTNLTVTDPLVTSVTCPVTTLPPAPAPTATVVCKGTHIVTAAEAAGTSITNVAHANATSPGPTNVQSNDSTVTLPLHASLSLTKAVATPGPYVIGQQVNYTYQVTNTGGATVASIGVTDNRVASGGVKCDLTSLDPGQSTSCTASTAIASTMMAADGTITNTANASGTTPVGQIVPSNQATATIAIAAGIGVAKTASTHAPVLGDQVSFTVTAHNYGPSTGTNILLSDPVPLGLTAASATVSTGSYDLTSGRWTIPALAVGHDATMTMTATVSTVAAVTNGVRVVSLDQPDLNPANDSASVLLNPVQPTADISVVKRVNSPTVVLGNTVTFTITTGNSGPYAASGVAVQDALPSGLTYVSSSGDGSYDATTGLWTIGDVAIGGQPTLTIVARGTSLGSVNNAASVEASSLPDPNQGNNLDTAATQVIAPTADLAVTKVVNHPTINVNGQVTYTITATNAGPDTAPSAQVLENIPREPIFTFISATPTVGSYDLATGIWSLGAFPSGATAQLQITVKADRAGSYNNTATISDPQVIDPDPSQNTASAGIAVAAASTPVDVGVSTTVADARVPVGTVTSVTVTLTNLPTLPNADPGHAVTNLVLNNQLPPGLELAGPPLPEDGTTFDASTGVWTIGPVAVGGTRTLTLPVRVTLPQTLIDTASVGSLTQTDVNDSNNGASAAVTGYLLADLSLTKTAAPNPPQVGGTITYTIVVTNHGPTEAGDIEVSDPLPASITIASSSVTQGTFDVGRRLWSVGTLANGADATLTIVVPADQLGSYVNTAVIIGSNAEDPNPGNQQATATLDIAGADIAVGKTVDVTHPMVGDTMTYTVTVRNLGPGAGTGVVIDDAVPAGTSFLTAKASQGGYSVKTGQWTVGALGPFAEQTLTIRVRADRPGEVVNTATVGPNPAVPDPDPTNNQASVTVDVAAAPPDLAVGKTVSADKVKLGQTFAFTLTATNNGLGAATNVMLTDPVPASVKPISAPGCTIDGQLVRCPIATLAPGAKKAFTVTVRAVTAGTFTNVVTGTTGNTDPVQGNNKASSGVQVLGEEFVAPPSETPTPSPSGSSATESSGTGSSGTGSSSTTSPSDSTDGLPMTGTEIATMGLAGFMMIGAGLILTASSRRRRSRRT